MTIERIKSYVSGGWREGAGSGASLVNPATEEQVATADAAGIDFRSALAFARNEGGPALRKMSFAQRAELLQKMSQTLHRLREPLIDSEILNGGCTRSDAKFDVDGAIGTLAAYADWGKKLGDARVLPDGEGLQLGRSPKFWGQHVYVPKHGVAVCINAFNFPAWGFAEKAACALLAGVPVMTKPATATALTAYQIAVALVDAQILPPGTFSFIGGPPEGLLDHLESQDVLAFTGGASTAKSLRARAPLIEKSVAINVEADSLNAAVLGPDVELGSDAGALFLKDTVKEITQKTGQKCTATRRVLIPSTRLADFQGELIARLAEVKVGDPARNEVGMGPLATRHQVEEAIGGTAELSKDAELVFGGPGRPKDLVGVPEGKGFFFPITILVARKSEQAPHVHGREVFGPVATLLPYSGTADEAIALVNAGGGSLVASVYSDDRAFLESVTLGIAPHHGRIYLGSSKVLDQTMGPGTVLPSCTHGGPGHAGGGEELGGLRGVMRFMQRTAIQGYRPQVEAISAR